MACGAMIFKIQVLEIRCLMSEIYNQCHLLQIVPQIWPYPFSFSDERILLMSAPPEAVNFVFSSFLKRQFMVFSLVEGY